MFKYSLNVIYSGIIDKEVNVILEVSHDGIVDIIPSHIVIKPASNLTKFTGIIIGNSPGRIEISASTNPKDVIEYDLLYSEQNKILFARKNLSNLLH